MPLKLGSGWNEVRFDLADFCRRAYGTDLLEVSRVTIHASCRLRRVYFSEKAYREEELPAEFKLFKVHKGAAAAVVVNDVVNDEDVVVGEEESGGLEQSG